MSLCAAAAQSGTDANNMTMMKGTVRETRRLDCPWAAGPLWVVIIRGGTAKTSMIALRTAMAAFSERSSRSRTVCKCRQGYTKCVSNPLTDSGSVGPKKRRGSTRPTEIALAKRDMIRKERARRAPAEINDLGPGRDLAFNAAYNGMSQRVASANAMTAISIYE
jgi:hypothetical protein